MRGMLAWVESPNVSEYRDPSITTITTYCVRCASARGMAHIESRNNPKNREAKVFFMTSLFSFGNDRD
jgi:ribosomal protein S26